MVMWYSKISKDINSIPDALVYYENELAEAKREVSIKGNVEKASANMPGIVEQRFNQLQELEAILNYMNIELRRLRSSYFKKYLENYNQMTTNKIKQKDLVKVNETQKKIPLGWNLCKSKIVTSSSCCTWSSVSLRICHLVSSASPLRVKPSANTGHIDG